MLCGNEIKLIAASIEWGTRLFSTCLQVAYWFNHGHDFKNKRIRIAFDIAVNAVYKKDALVSISYAQMT